MPTPVFQTRALNLSVVRQNAGSARVNVFDAKGVAVNVSTGYTAAKVGAQPNSNPNPAYNYGNGINLTSLMSFTFDETGFDISWTAAQANSIGLALQTLNNTLGISISNDSGTTAALVALGSISFSTGNNTSYVP